ncbi:MAG: hypothetical protein IJX30_00825 [Clostridia bacterium]|nr:hypothetical protein [Clostridia bacterium]
MNEEIEYAEMLEIPVSTVNVIHKKRRKKAQKTEQTDPPTLKDSVIAQVNTRVEDEQVTLDTEQLAEIANSKGYVDFDSVPDRIDTVRLFADETERKNAYAENFFPEENTKNDEDRYELNQETRANKAVRIALGVEFAAVCALCGAIFLTNVFVPNSAVNTFFRAVNEPTATQTDARAYSDFELSPVVSELSDAELSLSAAGVLTFTDECCVYPAVDGEVSEVTQNEDGSFTLKIGHSDTFTGVISGLDQVYYAVGDEVKCNVPVGYTNGETPVQVTMYSGGVLLNCFQLTEENCLAWVEE